MLAKAILVHGEIGYKFCWLLPSEDWIRRHQLGQMNQWSLGHCTRLVDSLRGSCREIWDPIGGEGYSSSRDGLSRAYFEDSL